jgi:hypothetical protein
MAQTPNQLTTAATCFARSIPQGDQWGILIYLFQQIAGMNQTPEQLVANSNCFIQSIPRGDQVGVLIYLAEQILVNGGTGGGGVGAVMTGTAANPITAAIVPANQNAGAIYYQVPGDGTGTDVWLWDTFLANWSQLSV